jgi:hypothetical protein
MLSRYLLTAFALVISARLLADQAPTPATPSAATPTAPTPATPSTAAPTVPAPAPTSQFMSQSLGVHVFPSKGQDSAQQQQDEATCFNWAKGNTGFDPLAPPSAAPPPQQSAQQPPPNPAAAAPRKGAVGGAAAGAAIAAMRARGLPSARPRGFCPVLPPAARALRPRRRSSSNSRRSRRSRPSSSSPPKRRTTTERSPRASKAKATPCARQV